MKRKTMCALVMVAALLAAVPGWAAPAPRVSSPVDQVLDWLGQAWRAVQAKALGFDASAAPEQPTPPPTTNAGCEWDPLGKCITG